MSKVHNAMRQLLEQRTMPPDVSGTANLSNLVEALLQELADELPDDPKLDPVRADLLLLTRSYESTHKKDLALRFYLAMRAVLRENELLQERARKAERAANYAQRPVDVAEPVAAQAV